MIKLENISKQFDNTVVLKNVNIEFEPEKTYAIIGSSGAGKSTLLRCINLLEKPSTGNVIVDGVNIIKDKEHLSTIREKIGMVTQRVYIFHDTVAANVAYGKTIEEERVIEALKKANAYEFIQDLEHGIYTHLDEFGTNLSGGQRQRIAIARAIYKNPQILILDEATSALDSHSEQKITEAIENLVKDKITFVIAHRLSTIKKADKIAFLKQGRIVALGSDEELQNSSAEYVQLKSLQY